MKIIIEITEDDFELHWTGNETKEEVVDLLYVIASDFDHGVRRAVRQAEIEAALSTVH